MPFESVAPIASPEWPVDVTVPAVRGGEGGTWEFDDALTVAGINDGATSSLRLSTGGSTGGGDTRTFRGRFCGFLGGGLNGKGVGYSWWLPNWGDGSEIAAGGTPDPLSTVAIFDFFFCFESGSSSYAAGTSGFFFLAGPTDIGAGGISAFRPAGASPRSVFGLEAVLEAGTGDQTLAFSSWDGNGTNTRLTHVQPPAGSLDPTDWNTAQLVIVGAGAGRAARVDQFRVNGDLVMSELDFGSAGLLTPQAFVATAPGCPIIAFVDAVNGMGFKVRARFGEYRPDGSRIGA